MRYSHDRRRCRLTLAAQWLTLLLPVAWTAGAQAQTPAPAPTKTATAAKPTASKSKPAPQPAGTGGTAGEQAIVVLVNDEPITAYEIDQRGRLIMISSGEVGEYFQKNAQERWKRIVSNTEKLNQDFREFATKHNPRTQEDIQRLQKIFIEEKQKVMREELIREARTRAAKGVRGKAQEELIEERLKLQEAKRLSVLAEDTEVEAIIKDLAQRNKMTEAQFAQHIASQGADIASMRARFKAMLSWNQVIRKRFGHQVNIGQRDIDKAVQSAPVGEDRVDLQLQRIVLPVAAKVDQKAVILRFGDAEKIRNAFKGCATIGNAAKAVPDARLENLGSRKPSTVAEPTRSMLLSAKEGDLLPPTVGQDGVELWVVCGRSVIKASEEKRLEAQNELRQREFELLAKRHLKDLRQDASIEFR